MRRRTKSLQNLGELIGEKDHQMLKEAFVETPDYLTIIERKEPLIVVGRRGTGKSALADKLGGRDNIKITMRPDEYNWINMRNKMRKWYGTKDETIRAATTVMWQYALMMEVGEERVKREGKMGKGRLGEKTRRWRKWGINVFDRMDYSAEVWIEKNAGDGGEINISEYVKKCELSESVDELRSLEEDSTREALVIIDALDDGFRPTKQDTSIICGIIRGSLKFDQKTEHSRILIFVRDNMFRAIEEYDEDYSRNIEGNVLRLHWGEEQLLRFVAKRLKVAYGISQESDRKIWSQCVEEKLRGIAGFKLVTQHTLQRPRDLLNLLNQTLMIARQENETRITITHLTQAAKRISNARLKDIKTEYSQHVPLLGKIIEKMENGPARMEYGDMLEKLKEIDCEDSGAMRREVALIGEDWKKIIELCFGIGLIGFSNKEHGPYAFCFDGRSENRPKEKDHMLVHPCYWQALGCHESNGFDKHEIYDEYSIEVNSESVNLRKRRIQDLCDRYYRIEPGNEHADKFEDWCEQALKVCFSQGLQNISSRGNRNAPAKRDIIARNEETTAAWRMIRQDYDTRQVVFEVKNKERLDIEDYRQISDYLNGPYGRCGFFVTHGDMEIRKGTELQQISRLYKDHNKLAVKLTGEWLCRIAQSLKYPRKHDHDAVDRALANIIDDYVRIYVEGQLKPQTPTKKRRGKKHNRRKT